MNYYDKYIKYKQKYLEATHQTFLPKEYHLQEIQFLTDLHYIRGTTFLNRFKQLGGFGVTTTKFTYKDRSYTFKIDTSKKNKYIRIAVIGHIFKLNECATVFIQDGIADLNNMSYFHECTAEGLKQPGGGDIIMQFIITYLKKNKKKYGIKRIILSDNSQKDCKECSHKKINLSDLRMVTHGEPWYMKYDFKPYDQNIAHNIDQYNDQNSDQDIIKDVVSNKILLMIDKNNRRVKKMTVTNFVNIPYFVKITYKLDKIKIDINEVMKIAEEHQELRSFITELLKDYNKYCCFVHNIITDLYKDRGENTVLYTLERQMYFLDI